MIFCGKERKKLIALCRPGPNLDAVLRAFAERSYARKPTTGPKVHPANTPVQAWLSELGLSVPVTSVPNNVVSKMLSRQWDWLNLVKPDEANVYWRAQRNAKEQHAKDNPGYKYMPMRHPFVSAEAVRQYLHTLGLASDVDDNVDISVLGR
tara:strand:- start:1861 stop:2313 length:453 start_codon:yes stop_codon:yes gene_type:complete